MERLKLSSTSESTGVLLLNWVGPNSNLARFMKCTASEPGLSVSNSDWLWRHRIRKFEILGLLMASICASRSVNVSKGGLCVKMFSTLKFRDIDTSGGAD